MWRVNVPNHLKVAVTRFSRADAHLVFAVRAMAPDQRTVNVTAIERPH